jgi:hypothetical protein
MFYKFYRNRNFHNHQFVYLCESQKLRRGVLTSATGISNPLTQQEIVQETKEIRRILEDLEKRFGRDTKSANASSDHAQPEVLNATNNFNICPFITLLSPCSILNSI